MRCLVVTGIAVGVWLCAPQAKAEGGPLRFAVVVGNNIGHNPKRPLRFAEADAEKIARTLIDVGGFHRTRVRLLLGANASQVWKAIQAVAASARHIEANSARRTMLMVYYSGHADGDALELGPTSLPFAKLSAFLKEKGIAIRLAFVDSCRSGSLVSMKGGRRGGAYRIKVNQDMRSSGYAIITSSTDDELSQEANEIRGSFFSHYLVSGLRGAADASRDGKVTLNELYRYTYSRTLARTTTALGNNAQHPMYKFKLAGKGELVISKPQGLSSYLSLAPRKMSRIVVLNTDGDAVIAERQLGPDHGIRVALAPGTYTVVMVEKERLSKARISLTRGQGVHLAMGAFQSYHPQQSVAKGGLFADTQSSLRHGVGVGFVLRKAALKPQSIALGAAAFYTVETSSGYAPMVRVTWGRTTDSLADGYFDLGLMAGLGRVFRSGRMSAGATLLMGYEHLFQRGGAGGTRHTSGFAYLGELSVGVDVNALELTLRAGGGGRVFQTREAGWVHRMDLQAMLSTAWRWR